MKNIVILGGGYGGLHAATQLLEEELPQDINLMLVDRMPFQGLKTEYYALATGTIADVDIRVPFPADPRLTIKYGNVAGIDMENRLIRFEDGDPLSYDSLIVALGCTDRYHDIPGADRYTHSIQSFNSSRETFCKLSEVKPYGQVTIVGGGLSGVELAAELRESRRDLNIRILDRGGSILAPFPERLRAYVRSWFEEHHVDMLSHISISRVEPGILHNGAEEILTDITVWTAGIQPAEVVQQFDVGKDAQGRVLLNEHYQIPQFPDVYVVGDCASLPFSPSAQAAEAQGKQVAQILQALWKGEKPKLEKIKLKGVLGSLGKKSGFGVGVMGPKTILVGRVPRLLKSGVLWISKHHFG